MGKTVKLCAMLALLGMAGIAVAEEQLPLPGFGNTYNTTIGVRGYWFQAPVDFLLTGLMVPNEGGHTEQSVEVVRFNPGVTPPSFPGVTNDFVSLYRNIRQPANQVLRPTGGIEVHTGDVIGIYGGCGDAGSNTLYMSYGTPPGQFASQIFGQPTTLTRSGMQFNLLTTPMQQIWQEPAAAVSRVHMYYDVIPEPAAFGALALGALALLRRR